MRATPPADLVDLLARLKLASPAELRSVHRHATRLAKDLTLFDSVWVDALVQARKLTPFQAGRINDARGESLRVGPYILLAPLSTSSHARAYRARELDSTREVRLTLVPMSADAEQKLSALRSLVTKSNALRATPHVVPVEDCGVDDGYLWVASSCVAGRSASEWLVRGGRMPPDVVLEIARQMVAALVVCEGFGVPHGDLAAQQLILDPLGLVQLLDPGVRGILRPVEVANASFADIAPEACDYLAPERIGECTLANTASDVYACGALWWHLLAGRPHVAGATIAARRIAAQETRVGDIHRIAPDTPKVLVDAIARCTERAIERRPAGFSTLLESLGPPSDRGQALLARYVARGASSPERLVRRIRTMRRSPHLPTWAAASGGVCLALLIGSWPLWTRLLINEPPQSIQPPAPLATAAPGKSSSPMDPGAAQANASVQRPVARPNQQGEIVPATAVQPVAPHPQRTTVSREFVISAARRVVWQQVRPLVGQVVRSRAGERAQILLPSSGGTHAIENVRFEDIDFIVPQGVTPSAAALTVTARHVAFHRCTLQGVPGSGPAPTAIQWRASEEPDATKGGYTGRFEMRECVLAGVDAGVRYTSPGDCVISLADVLFLGSGPLLNWDQAQDGSLALQLKHCTVRGASSVVDLQAPRPGHPAAVLHVEAAECVFAIADAGTILSLVGGQAPQQILRSFNWQGEGSVVGPRTSIVRWQREHGPSRTVGDAKLPIEGLVRTELGFAGDVGDGPQASRLVRWQVPLRSGSPPGINDLPLVLPPPR